MIADLYPEGAQTAIRFLTLALQSPSTIIHKDERLDLQQFIADLQDALDAEAERQYMERISTGL